jgi:hypothetical protein
VRCLINPDSTLGKAVGMQRQDYYSVTAWRDDQYARSMFIRLRDAKDGHTTAVSPDGSRIVDYDEAGTDVSFTVIDKSTGLNVLFSMDEVDQGSSLLAELGWDV